MAASLGFWTFCITVFCLGLAQLAAAQMKNTAPETIQSCYKNLTALNRANRQPMHIQNLIAILRKIEQKALHFRDMRRLARTIIKRFQFDGIYHDPDRSLELQYSPHPLESLKDEIIHSMIPDNADILELNILDNDERCALHWMVSHSLNATRRDDENIERYQRQKYDGGLRAKRATNTLTTNRPAETGTVYTDWGPIAAGRVIAAIAAALMEQSTPVIYKDGSGGIGDGSSIYPPVGGGGGAGGGQYPGYPPQGGNRGNVPGGGSGNNWGNNPPQTPPQTQYSNSQWRRNKRQVPMVFQDLKNIHAASIAGDVGQAAILNAPYYNRISGFPPPVGTWNDTICPREYILNALPDPTADPSHAHDTWSYMTGSEIRGGMDGLILASVAKNLAAKQFTLSQVLEMYYSQDGIYGENNFRACDRVSLFSGSIMDANLLREQSRSFAYLYNTKVLKVIVDPPSFNTLVDQAFSKMSSFQSVISSDPSCIRRPPDVPDQDKLSKPMGMIYAVLDHSSTYEELVAQQRFVAKLAFEMDVSPQGSRIGIVDGRTGQVLVSPNFTDNAAILACRILVQPQVLQVGNLAQVLRTLRTEITRVRDERERRGEIGGAENQITILVFVQGKKLDEAQRDNILDVLEEYDEEFGDVQVTYTSSKYPRDDFVNFMLRENEGNFIPIPASSTGNLSDSAEGFLREFIKNSHGSLTYPRCNEYRYEDQDNELSQGTNIFIKPNTIQFFKISPSTFFSSVDLRLRFTSENGKVRVCVARTESHPINYNVEENDDRDIECEETSGTYVDPETKKKDIEFIYTKPCRNRKREGCDPIYVSITPTETPVASGGVGLDCSVVGCKSPDEVRVTWTHYDMRCNGCFRNSISLIGLLLSIFMSVGYMTKHMA